MVKFKSNKDGFIFEAKKDSIHYDILMKSEEFEIVEENNNNEEIKDEAIEEKIDYSKLKVDELKEIAKEKGIENYQELKKAELIEVIEKAGE